MGFIGNILDGNKGAGFQAGAANVQTTATPQQVNDRYLTAVQALGQTGDLYSQLAQQQGLEHQQAAYQNAANLANGMGPNPAMAQLNQATAANTANQAAIMAGQRGASANPALIARQAAMQGAANQQNAIGQGATLQAQQQLAGQQQMANLANQQVQQQMQGNAANNQFAQGLYGQASGNVNAMNSAQVASMSSQNTANAAIAGQNAGAQIGMLSGIGSAMMPFAGKMMGPGGASGGGSTPWGGTAEHYSYAQGGAVPGGPKSQAAYHLKGMSYKSGGQVPGQAPVKGDSPKNDTVAAKLSPGEIVIPRSVTMSKDPVRGAAEFVRAALAKKGMK